MSQVKAEVALSLLKYFRWLAQSHKTALLSFYVAQKQRVKDSGQFSFLGFPKYSLLNKNRVLCLSIEGFLTDI